MIRRNSRIVSLDCRDPIESDILLKSADVAHIAGDRRREIRYTENALPYANDYSFAIYNFAQLLLRDGQADLAKRYATKAYELKHHRGNGRGS
jgi:hypothetical protein